jgi:hypothetical protein
VSSDKLEIEVRAHHAARASWENDEGSDDGVRLYHAVSAALEAVDDLPRGTGERSSPPASGTVRYAVALATLAMICATLVACVWLVMR